jgi:hypothetical protein
MIQIIDESVLFVIFDGTEMSFNLISFAAAASPIVMAGAFDFRFAEALTIFVTLLVTVLSFFF